jgi:hypothetical protein
MGWLSVGLWVGKKWVEIWNGMGGWDRLLHYVWSTGFLS